MESRLTTPLRMLEGVQGKACFSECEQYRFWLSRVWDTRFPEPRMVAFIGLNPSCADADVDDRTVRKCQTLARSWGYDGMYMLNLFPYRATNPADMREHYLPDVQTVADAIVISVSVDTNYQHILDVAGKIDKLVCAWGTNGSFLKADRCLLKRLNGHALYHLGLTKHGHPRHPLYLKNSVQPILWDRQ